MRSLPDEAGTPGLEHSAYILILPMGTDTLSTAGVLPSCGFPWLRPGGRGGPLGLVSFAVCSSEETPIGFYHEQTGALQAVAFLPIGCASMA